MNKLTAAAIALATLALVVPALASGASAIPPDVHHSRSDAFTLYAPTEQMAFLPVTAGKFRLGDRAVFSDGLLTAKGGESLGRDGGVCTVARIIDAASASAVLQCEVTFSVPSGQITTQALITQTNGNLTGMQPAAITGGTGKYRNATGEVVTKFLSTTEAYVTFYLDR